MKWRFSFTRPLAGVATLLSGVGLAGYQVAIAPPAAATTTITSTWSGLSTTSSHWSDSANWSTANSDQAPAAGSTVDPLTFPDLGSCDGTSTACYLSSNDLTGMSVGTINIDNPSDSNGTQGYNLSGDPITLTGGLNVNGDSSDSNPLEFSIPLTLSGASQTWAMPGSTTDISDNVTGPTTDVTVQASEAPSTSFTNLQLDEQVETKSFTFAGTDTSLTGTAAGTNGFLELNGADVNGANSNVTGTAGNPVNITDAAVVGAGSVGDLSVTGGDVNVADANGNGPVVLSADAATFDSNSSIDFDLNGVSNSTTVTPGTDYSQLTSTGAVDLGGANLDLSLQPKDPNPCVDPTPGTVYTLVQGASLTGTVNYDFDPAPSGTIVSVPSCEAATNDTVDQFSVNYTSTALTLTALDSTTTALSVTSNSPQVNQSDPVTATVTSTSGTPTGTVTFYDETTTETVIPGCNNLPLQSGKVTCNASFSTSGDHNIFAPYTPTSGSDFAPSAGGTSTAITVSGTTGSSGGGSTPPSTGTSGGGTTPAPPAPGTSSSDTTPLASSQTSSSSPTTVSGSTGSGASQTSAAVTVPAGALPSGTTVTLDSVNTSGFTPPSGQSFVVGFAVSWVTPSGTTPTATAPITMTITDPGIVAGDVIYIVGSNGALTKVGTATQNGTVTVTFTEDPAFLVTKSQPAQPASGGYRLVAADGGVFSFDAPFYGSTGNVHLSAPIVGSATTTAGGYYMVASDGGVFAFGPGAHFQGSMGGKALNSPIVGMAVDPATGGYWLVAADGGIFAFNAPFYGSTGGVKLSSPIVGIAAEPDGTGYYLVAKDGGVFAFGPGAHFQGSMGGKKLNQPIVGMAVDPGTHGYWLVASDGGMFSFNAPFEGSTGGVHLNKPIVGMAVDGATGGYWLVASDGGIFSFNAPFKGSTGNVALNQPIVTMSSAG